MAESRGLYRKPRPWGLWLTVVAIVVAAAVAGYLLFGDSGGKDAVGLDDPGATAEPTVAEPSATPTLSPTPTPTPSPTPASSPSPSFVEPSPASSTPASTASPCAEFPGNCPDGKPGWNGGFGGCEPAQLPPESLAPAANLTIRLIAPSTHRADEPIRANIEVTNNGDSPARFDSHDSADDGTLVRDNRPVSGVHTSDAIAITSWDLAPRASRRVPVTIQTRRCGDTSTDVHPVLGPGEYQAFAWLIWRTNAELHDWMTPATTVVLTS